MKSIFLPGIFAFGMALSGCAVHPLPDDVTGLSTYQIVRQIRCETRQAVIDAAIGYLTHDDVDEASRQIGIHYASNPDEITKLGPTLFHGKVRELFDLFWKTGVAYDYTLRATEDNNASTEVNFLKPFTNGNFTLGLKGSFDRQRQNERIFTTTDTFGGLVQNVKNDYCTNRLAGENFIYPIAGRIGIDKVVKDFVNLTLFANLGRKDKRDEGPPTMADTLQFKTVISGSIIPKVTFMPMSKVFRASDAMLTGVATRTDVHQVIIGLAIPDKDIKQVASLRGNLAGSLLTARGQGAELAAATAVDQVLTRRLFRPTVVLNEP